MSEVKYYDGEYKDIIVSIPTNTIEMMVKLKVYENGEVLDAEKPLTLQTLNMLKIYLSNVVMGNIHNIR